MKHLKLFENKDFSNFFRWLDDNNIKDLQVVGTRNTGKNIVYRVDIYHSEIKLTKKSGILNSEYGFGDTPNEAIEDYISKIQGKILVFNAYDTANRKELEIPENIELYGDIKKYNL